MAFYNNLYRWIQAGLSLSDDKTDAQIYEEIAGVSEYTTSHLKQAADALAATATAVKLFDVTRHACRVKAVYFLPEATLTASDTDYATISLVKNDAAAGSETTVASLTTETAVTGGTGDLAVKTAYELTLVPAATSLDAGQGLGFKIAKAGDGVVVPAGRLIVILQKA